MSEDKTDESVRHRTHLLYETAPLTFGFALSEEPASFAKLIYRIVSLGLDVDEEPAAAAGDDDDDPLPPLESTSASAVEEMD